MNTNAFFVAVAFLVAAADQPAELKEVAAWKGPGTETRTLRFSPDSKTLVTGEEGDKAAVVLWDARTGRKLSTLGTLARSVSSIAFTADSKSVGAADLDGNVKVWEVATHKERVAFEGQHHGQVTLGFTADGHSLLVAGDTRVESRTLDDGGRDASFERRVRVWNGGTFSADGKTLASPNYQDLDLWDVSSGKIRRVLADHHGGVGATAFSADGKMVALGVGRNEGNVKYHWDVKVYDGETGKELVTINGDAGLLHGIALDDKAQTLLVLHLPLVNRRLNSNDELRVYDLATGRERCTRRKLNMWGGALSPDGKLLATVEADNQIKVWEMPPVTTEKKP